jgi:uncharacterized integral membrane protein
MIWLLIIIIFLFAIISCLIVFLVYCNSKTNYYKKFDNWRKRSVKKSGESI